MNRQYKLYYLGLVFLLLAGVLMILSGNAFCAQKMDKKKAAEADVNMSNKKVTRSKTMQKGPSEVRMPSHSITVRVNGEGILRARKVKIKALKNAAPGERRRTLTKTLSLNNDGDVTHKFDLGSIEITAQGTWTVTVEQGPADEANYPDPAANVCFRGATPTPAGSNVVRIDDRHRNVTVDFTISYSILWNSNRLCW